MAIATLAKYGLRTAGRLPWLFYIHKKVPLEDGVLV